MNVEHRTSNIEHRMEKERRRVESLGNVQIYYNLMEDLGGIAKLHRPFKFGLFVDEPAAFYPILDFNIEDLLDLSTRLSNCFHRAKIKTFAQLLSMTRRELLLIQNFGRVSLYEIEGKLNALIEELQRPTSNDEWGGRGGDAL